MLARRILLCRLGGIGDVIQTLPFVRFLRNKYKNASIEYLTSENVCELLVNCSPDIDKVWVCKEKNRKQLANKIINNQADKVDYFFNLHGSWSFFFFNMVYIKARKYFQYRKNKNMHAALNFARVYDPTLSFFNLDSRVLNGEDSCELLEKYGLEKNKYVCFVIGVGSLRPNRNWPFVNWLTLAREFLNVKKDFKVVFLGGVDEENKFRESIDIKSNRFVNLLGKLTLSSNAQIISASDGVVSCDTGLLHLTSALGKKVVGLFGPTLPERTGPFSTNDTNSKVLVAKNCECVGLKQCKKNNESWGYCMDSLKVEDILVEMFREPSLQSVR